MGVRSKQVFYAGKDAKLSFDSDLVYQVILETFHPPEHFSSLVPGGLS